MRYDFETWQNRMPQGSEKWLAMQRLKPDVGPDIVPLSVADMEFVLAPAIRDGLISYMGTVVLGYTGPTPSYFAAIQSWLDRRQNMHIEQEWIETTPGVVDGIGLALRTITEPGDGVIIMTPVYYPFFDLIDLTGRAKLQMELTNTDGRYSIDFARLEELAADPSAKAILLCSPHNPVGRVWSSEELQQIGQIAEKHNLYVLSDEIHGDLIMPGHTFTPFLNACPGWSDRTITFTAPSKTFNLAGMQAASAIIPNKEIRTAFEQTKRVAGMFMLTTLSYITTQLAYTQCDGWYEEMLQVIDGNRQLATEYIERNIPGAIVTPLEGTYLLWVDLRCLGLDAKEMEQRMIEASLFFDEGYIFGPGGAGFERINLAAPRSVIQAAMERLAQVCAR